ncbi:MAG: hypothetical protein U0793_19770 [Gemmataceae bacterium]
MLSLVFGARASDEEKVEIVIKVRRDSVVLPLAPREQKRVDLAIEGGVSFLRRTQLKTGSWVDGKLVVNPEAGAAVNPRLWPVGFAALPPLALLECGVAPGAPEIQQAAAFVRAHGQALIRTYEVSLAILFLDRLGEAGDRPLIRSLILRLAGGQTALGGWGYTCPTFTPAQEKKLIELLRERKREAAPKSVSVPAPRGTAERADNSNTQFALLALWIARKYELPLDYVFGQVERRFRASQTLEGWDYNWWARRERGAGSMTCAGLLGLAVGLCSREEDMAHKTDSPKPGDDGIALGLRALAIYTTDPSDFRGTSASTTLGPKGVPNLYFLWSIERVGVLCNVRTIGSKDWYRWGLDLLLPTQRPDGSWLGRGSGSPVIDTSFALLFLKRSDLLPDLRESLGKRVTITDPGLGPKTAVPRTKSESPKKGADSSEAEEGPLFADLGAVKSEHLTKLQLRVRGPGTFRITGIRGDTDEIRVETDGKSREVHQLTVALKVQKTGEFQRTIYLLTDIPGQPEVAVQIRAKAGS